MPKIIKSATFAPERLHIFILFLMKYSDRIVCKRVFGEKIETNNLYTTKLLLN